MKVQLRVQLAGVAKPKCKSGSQQLEVQLPKLKVQPFYIWKDARPHWLIMRCKLLTFQQGSAAAPSSDQFGLSNSLASETEVDR
ncbi:unnamed protein product [Sphagnum jensenii]|uniref:Uncharacterized protein n=1 Tax=Sphagnum jensenii TaxID=128206 RepID=A0ABP1AL28_9BRYO